jgi:hypothetical protein
MGNRKRFLEKKDRHVSLYPEIFNGVNDKD